MIILEPSSDNQDECSPLTKGVETDITTSLATAPPPYAPTVPPNPIIPSYQSVTHSRHVAVPRRQSPFRRLLAAFAIACLVLLLWGSFLDSLNKVFRGFPSDGLRHDHGYKLGQIQATSHDDPGRVLPIQYPPTHPPQMAGSPVPLP